MNLNQKYKDRGRYFLIFFAVLLPFAIIGLIRIASIAFILAYFAELINRKRKEEKIPVGTINRVTGQRYNPDQERPAGQRDPNQEL